MPTYPPGTPLRTPKGNRWKRPRARRQRPTAYAELIDNKPSSKPDASFTPTTTYPDDL